MNKVNITQVMLMSYAFFSPKVFTPTFKYQVWLAKQDDDTAE